MLLYINWNREKCVLYTINFYIKLWLCYCLINTVIDIKNLLSTQYRVMFTFVELRYMYILGYNIACFWHQACNSKLLHVDLKPNTGTHYHIGFVVIFIIFLKYIKY